MNSPSPLEGEGWDGGSDFMKSGSRELRKNMTDAERKLWNFLRLRQMSAFKFRRQHPVGRYIVDFVCLEKCLIIEVDGGQHNEKEDADLERTAWLEKRGFRVLRFWNHEVMNETESVVEAIQQILNPPSRPSPSRGEGGHP